MTNQERAEKIFDLVWPERDRRDFWKVDTIQKITSNITQACAEARNDESDMWRAKKDSCIEGLRKNLAEAVKGWDRGYEKGFSEAIERAAKLIEEKIDGSWDIPLSLPDVVRALKPGEK